MMGSGQGTGIMGKIGSFLGSIFGFGGQAGMEGGATEFLGKNAKLSNQTEASSLGAEMWEKHRDKMGARPNMFGLGGGWMDERTDQGDLKGLDPVKNIQEDKGIFGKQHGFGSGKGKLSQIGQGGDKFMGKFGTGEGALSKFDWQGAAGKIAGAYAHAKYGMDVSGSIGEGLTEKSKFFAGADEGLLGGIGKKVEVKPPGEEESESEDPFAIPSDKSATSYPISASPFKNNFEGFGGLY